VARADESNKDLTDRTSRALARAGSSILVTSLTDLVAFAISATSALPALASFGAYASISIFFLWAYASTFFSACLNFDERRQRDNRRELFCCLTRNRDPDNEQYKEGFIEGFTRHTFANFMLLLSFPGLARCSCFLSSRDFWFWPIWNHGTVRRRLDTQFDPSWVLRQ
jgi:hypothetical protein